MSGVLRAQADHVLEADVLVIGGGPAATWAAVTAREEGANVILVDKGYCGASGVAVASTISHWWMDDADRQKAMEAKNAAGGNLSEFDWMERILDETRKHWPRIAGTRGYINGKASSRLTGGQPIMQGPVYLREMRRLLRRTGVKILDHAPALELLSRDGAIAGASGMFRQTGESWSIIAGGVVLATGGCAYRSGCLGANTNTGDGYLMAAEAGASLSGMEFGNYYGLVPVGASVDKNGYYLFARYFDAAGREIEKGWSPPAGVMGTKLARAFTEGPVFAQFADAPAAHRLELRAGQPNLFIQFDRLGIDPFTQRFAIEPVLEGTVRGTGGVAITDDNCWTGIEGLWVAGDTASREKITGASSGAGSANAAWTIASGRWAGSAAAGHARGLVRKADSDAEPLGSVGLRTQKPSSPDKATWQSLSTLTQQETLPLEKNGLRERSSMLSSLSRLDDAWFRAAATKPDGEARWRLHARETAAMLATARWSYKAALERTESRGMHVRTDHPAQDEAQRDRILVSGTGDIRLRRIAVRDTGPTDLQATTPADMISGPLRASG